MQTEATTIGTMTAEECVRFAEVTRSIYEKNRPLDDEARTALALILEYPIDSLHQAITVLKLSQNLVSRCRASGMAPDFVSAYGAVALELLEKVMRVLMLAAMEPNVSLAVVGDVPAPRSN